MTINDAINQFDNLKSNTYQQDDKIRWLSRLDAMVKRLIIDTHEGGDGITFTGYGSETELSTELLIPEPFDDAYMWWMEAQVDYHNGEYKKYNNAMAMFSAAYEAYQNYYNRNHMPIGGHITYF